MNCKKGIVNDIFIFNRALSQDEIINIMDNGIVKAQPVSLGGKIAGTWEEIKIQY